MSGIPPETWQPKTVSLETTWVSVLVPLSAGACVMLPVMCGAHTWTTCVHVTSLNKTHDRQTCVILLLCFWFIFVVVCLFLNGVGDCTCCSMGTIVVELYWQHAPKTCTNFAELSRRGYYNSTKFHRIIKDFMVQGGDPTGTGGYRMWYSICQSDRSPLVFFLRAWIILQVFFFFFVFTQLHLTSSNEPPSSETCVWCSKMKAFSCSL